MELVRRMGPRPMETEVNPRPANPRRWGPCYGSAQQCQFVPSALGSRSFVIEMKPVRQTQVERIEDGDQDHHQPRRHGQTTGEARRHWNQ